MPTGRSERPGALVDTSVAVALTLEAHEHHEAVTSALAGADHLGLAGHAAFETFSVLTRLPAPARLMPSAAGHVIDSNFPGTVHLSADATSLLLRSLATSGVAGGSVYDALVGAAAKEHGLRLCTRDRRAAETYRAIGVNFELV